MAFGGVIKLQGESEYRKALSDITNSLKVVGSELKKVSSLYDKNDTSVEKLSSTNETLTKQLKIQNDALDKARDMLKEAQSGYDKSADSVKEWQQKLEQARAELDRAKSSTEASADEIADLEAKVMDCETELGKAETTTAKYDTTVQRWTVEVNNAEAAVNKTTREIDKNEAAIKLTEWTRVYSWDAIKVELDHLAKRTSSKDDTLKFIDAPSRLEFLTALAIKTQLPHVEVIPNFPIDDTGLPTSTAGGGIGDIECIEAPNAILVEVTMAQGRTQTMMEVWPIERHLVEFKEKYEVPSQCVFVAPSIFNDTVRQIEFVKFTNNLIIRPYKIDDFVGYLEASRTLYK